MSASKFLRKLLACGSLLTVGLVCAATDEKAAERALLALWGSRYPAPYAFQMEWTTRGHTQRCKLWATYEEARAVFRLVIEKQDWWLLAGRVPAVWCKTPQVPRMTCLTMPFWEPHACTPIDFLLPFLQCSKRTYRGQERVRARPVHVWELTCPALPANTLRMYLDTHFCYPVRLELLDNSGRCQRRCDVLSFKKVDDQWIAKECEVNDLGRELKTRVRIVQALFSCPLPVRSFFSPTEGEPEKAKGR